ncbi:MAG: hypothetical protein H6684_14975 [Deltaproteobacteria bacterium]|nr:hypothetical protein [Deltaproteobacteria bacterium]MCB9479228.1 hypothetical protein [Deltaproteobacteria bacterium]MCB9490034.1 hypothetical protein [Deltaproteobacteria bacterium]
MSDVSEKSPPAESTAAERQTSPSWVRWMNLAIVLGVLALVPLFAWGDRAPEGWRWLEVFLTYYFVASICAGALAYLSVRVGDAARARKWRDFDRWLTAPAICFFIAFVWLVLFRLPLALYNRPGQTEINLAEQAGQQAEEAMQRYFAQHQRYTASLDDLRSVDPTIDPDREVEFKFVVATDSRYKFQTKYPGTAKVFQFTNQGVTPWDLKVTYPDDWEERESQF